MLKNKFYAQQNKRVHKTFKIGTTLAKHKRFFSQLLPDHADLSHIAVSYTHLDVYKRQEQS